MLRELPRQGAAEVAYGRVCAQRNITPSVGAISWRVYVSRNGEPKRVTFEEYIKLLAKEKNDVA